MVEWCLPQDIDLEGVEFKSMASGSHKIQSDFIYFRKGPFFGLACFANMPVESELERGARMKSVGILSPSYTLLYRYMHFLENQVRHQLETPGHYSHLAAFYEDKKGGLHAGPGRGGHLPPVYWLPSIHRYMYPEMKITHPAGCMSQFIKFFGEQILTLWKFALLRKRILIFSPPPVGVVCYRVYCCCCLANVSLPGIGGTIPESKPFFYVNVADIDSLEVEMSYVACTTEKIFEEKHELYDVYVDNQNVKTHHDHLQPLLKINNADREKYRRLTEQRQMLLYSQEVEGDYSPCEEDLFVLGRTRTPGLLEQAGNPGLRSRGAICTPTQLQLPCLGLVLWDAKPDLLPAVNLGVPRANLETLLTCDTALPSKAKPVAMESIPTHSNPTVQSRTAPYGFRGPPGRFKLPTFWLVTKLLATVPPVLPEGKSPCGAGIQVWSGLKSM
ncbi:DENN domain-containing protein 11 isoform X2 [Loxodonta africana]|uniref:DENN domain-containing protein 11 isoform X2 n=1 Tax=Loxodonta africana TaxID=9785 RepID=UPI0030D0C0EC